MAIDIKRLTQDAERLHRQQSVKSRNGTYAAIRKALPDILALRAKGVRWVDIAAALAAQGITQGSGAEIQPITTSRLTALVSDIQKREAEKSDRAAKRTDRPDLVRPEPEKKGADKKLRLAPELAVKQGDATGPAHHQSEEAIRRSQLEGIQHLLKKKDERR